MRWQLLGRGLIAWQIFALSTGLVTTPRAWAATYRVDAATGDDSRSAAEAQDPSTPWKTLSRALAENTLASGDSIEVAAGTYDSALGESFPLSLIDGVSIVGEASSSTRIVAPQGIDNFQVSDLALSSATSLEHVGLANEDAGTSTGIRFETDTAAMAPRIDDVTFEDSLDVGIFILDLGPGDGSFTGLIENSTFSEGAYGIRMSFYSGGADEWSPTIANNTFSSSDTGIDISQTSLAEGVFSPVVLGNSFQGNDIGFDYYGYATGGDVVVSPLLKGNTFTSEGQQAIRMTVSGITMSSTSNIYTFSPHVIDNDILGTGDIALQSYLRYLSRGDLVSDQVVAGNRITNAGFFGMYIYGTSLADGGGAAVDWTITNNTVTDPSNDGIVVSLNSVGAAETASSAAVKVAGNIVQGGSDGIYLWSYDYNAPQRSELLAGNTVTGASGEGLTLSLSGSSATVENDSRMVDNVVDLASLGAYYYHYLYGRNQALISGNTFTDNSYAGLSISGSFDATEYVSADVGGGSLSSPGLNVFGGNGSFNLLNYGGPMFAQNNYWGDTDADAIDASIADDNEEYGGAVDFSGFLLVEPTSAVDASLAVQLKTDVGIPGPSEGDTLAYTATLKSTGTIGCASASFGLADASGVSVVPGSATTTKGLVLNDSSSDLRLGLEWLAPGETIVVTWEMAVREGEGCSDIQVQGALNCTQLGTVLTDDPAGGGTEEPTVLQRSSLTYYYDADNDSFGDAGSPVETCTTDVPQGAVDDASDCDDSDGSIYPGAPESCDGADQDCDSEIDEGVSTTYYADSDLDGFGDPEGDIEACELPEGYVSDGTDCDDAEEDTYPGATELCDGRDNDCNDVWDDNATTVFYEDADQDGYGNPGSTTTACAAPTGYVSDDNDCDDGDAAVNPGAIEVCDGVDNNCSGAADEGTNPPTWYADTDSDGFGNASSPTTACTQPTGYVSDDNDCNDASSTSYPNAPEACDGLDNDCDGDIDDGQSLSDFYADADDDGYGDAGESLEACAAPAGYADNDEDCDDSDEDINPDARETCDGDDNDCDGDIDEGVQNTYYEDTDDDDFGNDDETTEACSRPNGYADDGGDCDDDNDAVNPDADEVCDSLDNNCDDQIDEGVLLSFYPDADADGYGDLAGTAVEACAAPSGYAASADDCDDTNADVHPNATETCDGVDQDCNSDIDDGAECEVSGDVSAVVGNGFIACSQSGEPAGRFGVGWIGWGALALLAMRRRRDRSGIE